MILISSPHTQVANVHLGFVDQELRLQCPALVDTLGQNYKALKNGVRGRDCKS